MAIIFGLILLFALIRLSYYLVRLFIFKGKRRLQKHLVKELEQANHRQVKANMPIEILEVVLYYMKNVNKFEACEGIMTDHFLKEVYYATMQVPMNPHLDSARMIKEIEEESSRRAYVKEYAIEGFRMHDKDHAVIEVRKVLTKGTSHTSTYVLKQDQGMWKFHHIMRGIRGTIKDVLELEHGMFLLVGNNEYDMLFAMDSKDMPVKPVGTVEVEGYLNVETNWNQSFYYQLFNLKEVG